MLTVMSWLDLLFGRGDDGFPFWLLCVRINILVFVASTLVAALGSRRSADGRGRWQLRREGWIAIVLLVVAGLLRVAVEHNLTALGGIGYSRILIGYRGHFGTSQLYSLLYTWLGRDLEVAILLNRLASTATVGLVYVLSRQLVPELRAFALLAALLLALHPLHLLFTPTDGLPISTSFLGVLSYVLLVRAGQGAAQPLSQRRAGLLAALSGLTLLTQIRYENVLLLIPAVLYLWVYRRELPRVVTWPGFLVGGFCLAVYGVSALGSRPSHASVVALDEGLWAVGRELVMNPMYGLLPLLVGTLGALISRRSRQRCFAVLPMAAFVPVVALAILLEGHDYSVGFVGLARTFVNLLLPMSLMAAYGLAILWESPWRIWRLVVVAVVLWTVVLPVLFWPNLRGRYVETAEHDFLSDVLRTNVLTGVDQLIVPDDELLYRESHSTIEVMQKYRAIAYGVGGTLPQLVGMTAFLEHPESVDCSRDNCLLFYGLPCSGISHYWFAKPQCAEALARAGALLREEHVDAGSFLDCSLNHGEERQRLCASSFGSHRLAVYRARQP